MKKITLIPVVLLSAIVLSSCNPFVLKRTEREDAMKLEGMMPKEDDQAVEAMMEKTEGNSDAMMKADTTVQADALVKDTPDANGSYTVYSESAVSSALAAGKKVILFFHAPWCPTC
ncbi:hypothetical protein KBB89_00020, partial [Candidatus Gracilibacteria bacterium]|nr:hypothetical protein [Candidatus Gracilibacteria bacterium]